MKFNWSSIILIIFAMLAILYFSSSFSSTILIIVVTLLAINAMNCENEIDKSEEIFKKLNKDQKK